MPRIILLLSWVAGLFILGGLIMSLMQPKPSSVDLSPRVESPLPRTFLFQSIDTMKYSRDPSREKLGDPSFDEVIERQVSAIALTGATHVAIATPYDEEFVPVLNRWVAAARRHHLKVWYRGNWSGWEEWFGYSRITRGEHLEKTRSFILSHPELFEDGDVFSSCPECENGGPGDPRQTGDVLGHRQFLIEEYQMMQAAFRDIDKAVETNLFSMNGDVAKLVMDKSTTTALGGVVTIDHYVATPQELVRDVQVLAEKSGGKIILGEFGVPIPDIHGEMTEQEQATWLQEVLQLLSKNPQVRGVNYWVGTGGSTQLWNSKGDPRAGVAVLTRYYQPDVFYGWVSNEDGKSLPGVRIEYADGQDVETDHEGAFGRVFNPEAPETATFSHPEYETKTVVLAERELGMHVILQSKHRGFWERIVDKLQAF